MLKNKIPLPIIGADSKNCESAITGFTKMIPEWKATPLHMSHQLT